MPVTYEIVPGIFSPSGLSEKLSVFGLLDESPDRWTRLREKLERLNEECGAGQEVKLIWLARHGEGYHNLAEKKYGPGIWNTQTARENGDDEITWGPDPLLTSLGEQQAASLNEAWKIALKDGMPSPEKWFCSPMRRTASTLEITFRGLLPDGVKPLFIENIREHNGVHTCDKRLPKSILASAFPNFDFLEPMEEEDVLWDPDHRESEEELVARIAKGFEQVVEQSGTSRYISVTAHSGAIRAMLYVLGHPPVALPTGGVIPVVVRITTKS
ncbi:phosphoglycerate mutase-like protein [Sistotremastrum niveocremeum HHB9708]|uniref:Phosphoglycerate mutase-like protein n=1 Tax=Sistotremastrum niveocremeum HHB9708 TaxID=1314777 RepID=A0A164Z2T8_9AGAM|nr:phosphoglycerate mutase-like protein [Sistotremastrum niveocremeum HHB9708]